MASITNKSIRIEDLPRNFEAFDEDIFIINALADDTTYSISWFDLRSSFTSFPNGISLPCGNGPTDPALKFGVGNSGIYSPCPGGDIHIATAGLDRVLVLENGLTRIPGDLDIGTGCTTNFIVRSDSLFECQSVFNGDVTIGGELVIDNITVGGNTDLGNTCQDVTTIQTLNVECDSTLKGNLFVGDPNNPCDPNTLIKFYSDVEFLCGVTVKGNINLGNECADIINVYSLVGKCDALFEESVTINKNLTASGNVVLGTSCSNTLTVTATATFECAAQFDEDVNFSKKITSLLAEVGDLTVTNDAEIGGDLEVTGDVVVDGTTTLNDDLEVKADATITGDVIIGTDCTTTTLQVNSPLTSICDITSSGKIEGGTLVGDGSGITNLNIPNSLRFRGDTDVTQPVPTLSDPLSNGDFFLNIVDGNADSSYTGIAGDEIVINQFVYYVVDSNNNGTWGAGSIHDAEGVVTVAGDQSIFGDKTFDTSTTTKFDGDVYTKKIFQIQPVSQRPVTGFANYTIEDGDSDKVIVNKEYLINKIADVNSNIGSLTNTLFENDDTDTGVININNSLTNNEYLWYDSADTILVDGNAVGKWKRVKLNSDKISATNSLPLDPSTDHPLPAPPTSSPLSQTEANQWYTDAILHLHQDVKDIASGVDQVDLQLVTENGNSTDQGITIVDDVNGPNPKITLKNDGTSIFEDDMRLKKNILVDGFITQNSSGDSNSYGSYYYRVTTKGDVDMGGTLNIRHTGGDETKISSLTGGEVTFGHRSSGDATEIVSVVMHKTATTLDTPLTQVPVMPTNAEKNTVLEVMSTVRSPIIQATTFDIELLPSLP